MAYTICWLFKINRYFFIAILARTQGAHVYLCFVSQIRSKAQIQTVLLTRYNIRGIEWYLRAFASMRAVRLFLRARAVINFLLRAASTLEITNGEERALRKFSASCNLSLLN